MDSKYLKNTVGIPLLDHKAKCSRAGAFGTPEPAIPLAGCMALPPATLTQQVDSKVFKEILGKKCLLIKFYHSKGHDFCIVTVVWCRRKEFRDAHREV